MDAYSAVPEIRRLRWLVRFAVVWAVLIFGRLFFLQIVKQQELGRVADSQQLRELEVRAPRGTIYDRNGEELAVSVPVDSLAINAKKLKDIEEAVRLLAPTLSMDPAALRATLTEAREKRRGFVWIKRKLSKQESVTLRKQKKEWLDFREESQREYPHRSLASNVLGFVDHQEHGAGGVELSLQDDLEGVPGSVRLLTDVKHRGVDQLETTPSIPGANVALTLDARLQFIADRELKKAVDEHHCISGTLIVMDPRNGDILAMSNVPSFDPTEPVKGVADMERRLNRTVSVVNDPGSVFKMFTVAAALETTRLNANSVISCGSGIFRFGDQVIHDTHSYGALTLEQVIWKSSNVGAINIGIEVGKENLYRYLRAFGFGSPTGINLPGESGGLLTPLRDWTKGSLYYVAFGHEVGITTLQLAQACSVFANGGYRVRPRIVRWRQREGESRQMEPESPKVRVLKAATAIEMRRISEGVVLYGTGTRAKLIGYTSGGKTGTAQMFDKQLKHYVKRYNSTFMGYAPLNDPAIVVIATLDGSTEYGGIVAAPVFREVAQAALRILGQEPDVPGSDELFKPKTPIAPPAPAPEPLPMLAKNVALETQIEKPRQEHELVTGPRIPDFRGMSKRQVVETSVQLGMPVDLVGKGLVKAQMPAAGSVLPDGERIKVYFAR